MPHLRPFWLLPALLIIAPPALAGPRGPGQAASPQLAAAAAHVADLSSRRRGRRSREAEDMQGPSVIARLCREETLGAPDETAARIGAAITPTEAQRATLDELKAATVSAAESLRAACAAQLPVNPVARFEAMERQTEAMLQAFATLRPALEKLDGSLSDEQRTRFGIMSAQARGERRVAPCAEPGLLGRWPLDRISQELRPDVTQRNALIDLWAASAKAMNTLEAECPRDTPITPLGRLQSIEKRLGAMRQAVSTVRVALAAFYRGLNDEQKARFDQMSLGSELDEFGDRPRRRR